MCSVNNAPLGTACSEGSGTTCDAMGNCVAGTFAFVTSAAIPASFMGTMGGDGQCAAIAKAQGFKGTWVSWTSDSMSSPSVRFTKSTLPYFRLDGVVIATSWSDLIKGTLSAAISVDELGGTTAGEVWTNTATNGTVMSTAAGDCADWTDATHADTAPVGLSGNADGTWSYTYLQFCDYGYQHLYCFQQ
jgi:hypothetical protein